MDAVPNTPNQRPNPLVPLTVHAKELLEVDAVLLTHSHRDHLDDTAVTLLPKNLPILCQPADEQKLKTMGFTDVLPIDRERRWNEITINRTGGQHGTGEIGRQMGPVSGYVLTHAGEPSLYIAGDTIWCQEVEEALKQYQPAVTVLFSGAAQFNAGDPITMAPGDIAQVAEKAPDTNIVVAHM
ncbi:MBL fold metallo-hydrolase, partial [Microbacteriaceae bacterium K1510]|nr:MBL fold metallo-hydrolase [Microbacteriaceae bacterium K1510]